ncbi:MAG: ATP-binding protein [Candidatus Woesearchaeota archaeon]
MLTLKELKEISKKELPLSHSRPHYIEKISKWLKNKEIIIIKGIRRCGKTHIMYQLIKLLPKDSCYYFNFEDFYFENYKSVKLLEQIIKLRNPNERTYFFFDEIQQIKGFEKWLRTYYDKEINIKFIIGGSNISLLTPELATVLTGRNMTFVIKPLSWNEAKEFKQISFDEYLLYGGFPEIVLQNDKIKKKELLKQYIDDIIAKDIIFRYKAENPNILKSLAYFFLTNPGVKISANKLGRQIGVSKETAQKHLNFIIDTFMLFEVPFFSWSEKTKYIGNHASKYYIIDNGFHTAVSLKINLSLLYENMIAIFLDKPLAYWEDKVEIDFISGNKAIQITASNRIAKRELKAFDVFNSAFKNFENLLITPNTTSKSISIKDFIENR